MDKGVSIRRDRHSSSGSRGLPKKGGAGGKGTWGRPGDELNAVSSLDKNDPNYDPEDDAGASNGRRGDTYFEVTTAPQLEMDEFEKVATPVLEEYFSNGDPREVEEVFRELNATFVKHQAIVKAVEMAMGKGNAERELVSTLISSLYPKVFTKPHVEQAFHILLADIDDTVIDIPDAGDYLGKFLARAVADDCLAPAFVTRNGSNSLSEKAQRVLKSASALISMKHGMSYLDHVWGCAGGRRPMKELANRIGDILAEFLSSEEVGEAVKCCLELDVPHFHHEIIYQVIVKGLEGNTRGVNLASKLIHQLSSKQYFSTTQIEQGYRRVFQDLPDLVLDIPNCRKLIEFLVKETLENKSISANLADALPSGGRKRFVSEGDGGKIKA